MRSIILTIYSVETKGKKRVKNPPLFGLFGLKDKG